MTILWLERPTIVAWFQHFPIPLVSFFVLESGSIDSLCDVLSLFSQRPGVISVDVNELEVGRVGIRLRSNHLVDHKTETSFEPIDFHTVANNVVLSHRSHLRC